MELSFKLVCKFLNQIVPGLKKRKESHVMWLPWFSIIVGRTERNHLKPILLEYFAVKRNDAPLVKPR